MSNDTTSTETESLLLTSSSSTASTNVAGDAPPVSQSSKAKHSLLQHDATREEEHEPTTSVESRESSVSFSAFDTRAQEIEELKWQQELQERKEDKALLQQQVLLQPWEQWVMHRSTWLSRQVWVLLFQALAVVGMLVFQGIGMYCILYMFFINAYLITVTMYCMCIHLCSQ